jgi:hypothetical protein
MPSSFTTNLVKRLVESRITGLESSNPSVGRNQIHDDIRYLEETTGLDERNIQKRNAVASKVAISLYSEALETCLKQAIELDNESNWWRDVESKQKTTVMYFLQSESFILQLIVPWIYS